MIVIAILFLTVLAIEFFFVFTSMFGAKKMGERFLALGIMTVIVSALLFLMLATAWSIETIKAYL